MNQEDENKKEMKFFYTRIRASDDDMIKINQYIESLDCDMAYSEKPLK